MLNYFFRVDGGSSYSLATGHIKRCLKLADYISNKERSQVTFIMKDYKEGINLVKDKYKVIHLDIKIDLNSEIEFLKTIISQDGYFICDIRNINNDYIARIKRNCFKLVLFDDLGVKQLQPDLLINPTPFCYQNYDEAEYPNTTLLLGEKFFFVNPQLVARSYVRDFHKERYSIIASFGGADPLNITDLFMERVVPALSGHNLSVILGPAYAKKEEIRKKYTRVKNVKFYLNPDSLDELFLENDIAFVCAGDTCLEACASGIATFIISSIYYEKDIGKMLDEKNFAYFVADIEKIKDNDFDYSFLNILEKDKASLTNLSQKSRGFIDGKGLERTYNFLCETRYEHKESGIYTH